jgi:hypothetical protein
VQLGRFVEALNDVGCFDSPIRVSAQEQARVVIDPVDDLDNLARGQRPGGLSEVVGDRLRALIRCGRD